LSFLKDGISSFVGPRSSTFGGSVGFEPLRKDVDPFVCASSWLSSRIPVVSVVPVVSAILAFCGGVFAADITVSLGSFAGTATAGGSFTAAGLFSHCISEDCGILKARHGLMS